MPASAADASVTSKNGSSLAREIIFLSLSLSLAPSLACAVSCLHFPPPLPLLSCLITSRDALHPSAVQRQPIRRTNQIHYMICSIKQDTERIAGKTPNDTRAEYVSEFVCPFIAKCSHSSPSLPPPLTPFRCCRCCHHIRRLLFILIQASTVTRRASRDASRASRHERRFTRVVTRETMAAIKVRSAERRPVSSAI